ncbi:MAG: beta-lactamase family protein [Muribaculaceae bacterium]|nr:beta-lactamase family protein [Muribaculaceae bacterium]
MKRPARKACPLLFFFPLMNPKKLSALLAIAAHPVISVATDVTQQLDSLFESRYPNQTDPGAAVVIARGDSIIYERYFGIADIQSQTPEQP